MKLQYAVILFLVLFQVAICQFFGGNGFNGGYFGCTSYLPTLGNQCHMIAQDGSLICVGNKKCTFSHYLAPIDYSINFKP